MDEQATSTWAPTRAFGRSVLLVGVLVLSGMPSDGIPFSIEKITPVSTAKEGRNYFRTEAKLNGSTATLRPGMEGVGKVEVEQRLYARIWTRQITDWIRLAMWRWIP